MSDTLAQPVSYVEGPPAPASEQDLRPISSVPWIAIALAAHVLFLVMAWFILPQIPTGNPVQIISAASDVTPIPPEVPIKPPEESIWPDPDKVTTDPQPEKALVDEATETHDEEPTNSENHSIAENPDPDQNVESPNPNRGPSTATGIGGGGGGGKGRGGLGGKFPTRGHGGPGGPEPIPHVDAALRWLRDHQNFEGFWSATNFSDDSTRKNARKTYNLEFNAPGDSKGDKGWGGVADIGLTGISLLAFAGQGYDHKNGEYKETCRRALMYLRKVQGNDGCFGPKDEDCFVYNHAICTMAVAEIYGISGDPALKANTERAVDFILNAQNEGSGWRYGVKAHENDTSVTGWMVLALKSCKMVGIEFDAHRVYGDAAKWLDTVTVDTAGYPKTGYNMPGSDCARLRSSQNYVSNPSMDSINIMTRLFMGDEKWDVSNRTIKSQAAECARNVPEWKHEKIDYYYWYYASLALYQVDGPNWKTWEKAMKKTLFDNQRGWRPEDKGSSKETLDEHGSWDSVDAWGTAGGRVYATAINCLTLEVWTRYERLHKEQKKEK